MTPHTFRAALLTGAAALLALPAAAQIENQVQGEDLDSTLDEIIVTGVAQGAEITQFESTVSISTFGEDDLAELSPITIADIFAQVPGVWAESSGGGAASNVFIRGIPAPGQFLFSKIQVDGLPVFEEQGIGFLTPDGLYRNDFTTRRLEAVRGGSSSVFASNAPGGIFNFISKRGSEVPEGGIQYEYGNFGHHRLDANYAGPISDDTFFSIGGFFRVADGVRDPGFRGDEGGQISGNITRRFDRGDFTVSAQYIDDRNLFLLPIPLGLDEDGDLDDLAGLDANFDTLVSDDVREISLLLPGGPQTFDLADGINNTAASFGTEFDYDLGNGWTLTNRNRYIDGETQFNTSISVAVADGNDFLDGQLAAAQAAFMGVDSVTAVFADNGEVFDLNSSPTAQDGQNGNGLISSAIFFPTNSQFENFINDVSISKSFETGFGSHDLTASFYTSFYSIEQLQYNASFLQEVTGSPRNIDILALDAAGNTVGTLTQNGFTNFAGGFQNYSGDGEVLAWVLSDSWEVNDRLRIDGGLRFETLSLEGAAEVGGTFDLTAQNTLLPDSAPPTTAATNVNFGTGQFVPFDETYNDLAWTVGANYVFTDTVSAFGRLSDGVRTPSLDDLANAAFGGTDGLESGEIFQVEGGVKLDLPFARAFVTGFLSEVDNQSFTEPVSVNGVVTPVTFGQNSETIGLEIETEVGPFYGASLNFKGTFQDPDLDALVPPDGLNVAPATDLDGNRVPRIPGRILSIQPRYDFNTSDFGFSGFGDGLEGSLFATIYNVGDRFQDFTNQVELPGYTSLNLGARLQFPSGIHIGANWDNVTNTIGLTEGNPRTDLFAPDGGGGVQTATFGRPIVGRNFRINLGYTF